MEVIALIYIININQCVLRMTNINITLSILIRQVCPFQWLRMNNNNTHTQWRLIRESAQFLPNYWTKIPLFKMLGC